jgi:hypothetical protein
MSATLVGPSPPEEINPTMRRLIAAAVTVTGALLLAGCSTDKTAASETAAATTSPGAATGESPAPASRTPAAGAKDAGDAALSGDTAAICNQAAKTGGQAAATFAQDLKLLIDAESAKDKAAVAQAQQKTTRDVQNYSYALKDMSKLVADPAVKKALADMAGSVDQLKGDVRKLDADDLGRLQGTLGKACGNG